MFWQPQKKALSIPSLKDFLHVDAVVGKWLPSSFLKKARTKMASSRERIIQTCNGLQIPAISLDWADQAWISDFCEPVELPEVLENRIVDCKYFVGDLQTLLVSLKHWSTRYNQSVDEGKHSSFDRL